MEIRRYEELFRIGRIVAYALEAPDIVIDDERANPENSDGFFEIFDRNQMQNVPRTFELIRSDGVNHLRFVPLTIEVNEDHQDQQPARPQLHRDNPAIPLPEFASDRQEFVSPLRGIRAIREAEGMHPIQGIWGCACPIPGTKPLISCGECRRKDCVEWSWNPGQSETSAFQNSYRNVMFNTGFSVGTAAVRGSEPLRQGYHHYWEIEMSTEVYGTDMMIGVGTDKADLVKHAHNFVSLIGLDTESWGISYTGAKQHNGQFQHYTNAFGQFTVIGVHLDMWSGKLEFYINRKPAGLAFDGLQGKVLYPMLSSTAARSGMNLIFSRSYPHSLQLQTMLSLGKHMLLPDNVSLFKVLPDDIVPPGLKVWMKNNFWWITSNRETPRVTYNQESIKEIKKTDKKEPSNQASLTVTEAGPSSQLVRRGRKTKTKKDDMAELETELGGVVTRSMASRRTFVPGTNPIFAPPLEGQTPPKSLRMSEGRRPITRSTSSPSVPNCDSLEDEEDNTPYRPASSNSNEPGSKRMCLRSSKR